MKCRYCASIESKVIDSRPTEDGSANPQKTRMHQLRANDSRPMRRLKKSPSW